MDVRFILTGDRRPLTASDMTLVGIFAAFSAGGPFVRIPFDAVPITLQTLFVLLAGIILGPRLAAWSQVIYISMGLMGLPIFTGGGGPGYIYNPTFGYLIGFIVASYVVGYLAERFAKGADDGRGGAEGKGGRMIFAEIFGASLIGSLIIYLIGLPYMYVILRYVNGMDLTFGGALGIGMLRFLPGDIIKCVVAAAAAPKLISILRRAGLRK